MLRTTLAAAAATLLVLASPAAAAPVLLDASAAPADPAAGAHADFDLRFSIDGLGGIAAGDDLRHLDVELPPGLVGDPSAAPRCRSDALQRDACPADTTVGSVTARADVDALGIVIRDLEIPGSIYNLQTRGTEPARLGIVLRPATPVIPVPLGTVVTEAPIRVRTTGDGGLTASIRNLPRTQSLGSLVASLRLERMEMRLNATANGRAFMTNPTSCAPAPTVIHAQTYETDAELTARAVFTPRDCAGVPFSPGLTLSADPAGADVPTSLAATVSLPYDASPAGRGQSTPRTARVDLPEGFELAAGVGSGGDLVGCTDAQFARTSPERARCPAGSRVGSVTFSSPLLPEPLRGDVFLATPEPGGALAGVFITADQSAADDAVRVKLVGDTDPDPRTGQVRATLTGLPPLPFTSFRLAFRGGPHAVFSTPRRCGTYAGAATMTAFSGATAAPRASVAIAGDCPDPAAFAPSVALAVSPSQAGADTTITTTVAVPARNARVSSMSVALPPGLLGRLTAAVPCAVADARAAACPASAQIGTVQAAAGPGSAPLSVSGPVYLTEGFNGAVAGLAIVVPAKVGPLDLGNAVTLASLAVRPDDGGLTIVAPDVPTRLRGVALAIRELRLTFAKTGFAFNATSCAQQTLTATLGSDLSATATASAPYAATGCERLPFQPTIEARMTGGRRDLDEGGHPGLSVIVRQGVGEANAKKVAVGLPEGLSADVSRLDRACPIADYDRGACPSSATVGSARADTPLLPTPLEGTVVLVRVPGTALPQLRIRLRGVIALDLNGEVTLDDGRLQSVIDGIPDVPLSRFELYLKHGDAAPLVLSEDACSGDGPSLRGTFTAHAGGTATATATPERAACDPSTTVRLSSLRGGQPALRVRVNGQGRQVVRSSLWLPDGLAFDVDRVRDLIKIQTAGGVKKGRAKVKVSRQHLVVTLPGDGAQRMNVVLRHRALRVGPKTRSASSSERLRFRLYTRVASRKRSSRSSLRVSPSRSALRL